MVFNPNVSGGGDAQEMVTITMSSIVDTILCYSGVIYVGGGESFQVPRGSCVTLFLRGAYGMYTYFTGNTTELAADVGVIGQNGDWIHSFCPDSDGVVGVRG